MKKTGKRCGWRRRRRVAATTGRFFGVGGCKSINSLGNGRAGFVSGSPRLMKGVGGGQNDGRTRVKEDRRRAQS